MIGGKRAIEMEAAFFFIEAIRHPPLPIRLLRQDRPDFFAQQLTSFRLIPNG